MNLIPGVSIESCLWWIGSDCESYPLCIKLECQRARFAPWPNCVCDLIISSEVFYEKRVVKC